MLNDYTIRVVLDTCNQRVMTSSGQCGSRYITGICMKKQTHISSIIWIPSEYCCMYAYPRVFLFLACSKLPKVLTALKIACFARNNTIEVAWWRSRSAWSFCYKVTLPLVLFVCFVIACICRQFSGIWRRHWAPEHVFSVRSLHAGAVEAWN